MRVSGLLALSFSCLLSFALISVYAAPTSDQAPQINAPAAGPAASTSVADREVELQSPASDRTFDKRYGILRGDPDSAADPFATPAQRYFDRVQREEDGVCYKLRSYKVARDDRDSDSTHPAGYTTCQRASQFQVRNAEEVVPPEKK